MAIKPLARIVLYEQLNQDKITALLATSDTVVFEIERRYVLGKMPEVLTAILPVQFTDIAIDYMQAFKDVVDASTWVHEENAIMFKVEYNSVAKEFDLTSSFVRDVRDTSGILGNIVTGQVLEAVFTTPGLDGPVFTTINLPYGQSLDVAELSVLKDNGVLIDPASSGDFFTVTSQLVPYRVFFKQPSAVITEKYSVEFELQNKTIEI